MITTTAARWPIWGGGTKRGLPSWQADAYGRATNAFPIELGGVAFKQKRYAEAARWLREGLQLAPNDAYANDFLATIYFLEGNTEAALKYWNRIAKPHLENVRIEPGLRVDPALLDRAFAFAPASTLRLPDFLTTQTRVEALGHLPGHQSGTWTRSMMGHFDMAFQAQERNGWGNGKWEALLSTFRGAFIQTAYPGYFNWGELGDQPDVSRALGRSEAPFAGCLIRAAGAQSEIPLPGRRRSAQ